MAQSVSVNSRGTPSKNWIGKAPEDILTVKFDFGLFFDGAATSHTSSVTGELGIESSALLDNIVTVVISGGENGGTPSLVVSATDGTDTKQVSLEIVVDNFLDEATSSGSGGGGVPGGGGDTITAFVLVGDTLTITTDQGAWPVDLSGLDQSAHVPRTDNPHVVTKAQVGLGNADNTSDIDKPISSAQQTALDNKRDSIDGLVIVNNLVKTITESTHTLFVVNTTVGASILTLPVASDGVVYIVKKQDAGAFTVTINTNAAETIDGAGDYVIASGTTDAIKLVGITGVGWVII